MGLGLELTLTMITCVLSQHGAVLRDLESSGGGRRGGKEGHSGRGLRTAPPPAGVAGRSLQSWETGGGKWHSPGQRWDEGGRRTGPTAEGRESGGEGVMLGEGGQCMVQVLA